MKKIALFLLATLFTAGLRAQDFRQAAMEARKAYGDLERLHVVMSIKVFEDASDPKPYFSQTADVKKDGYNYRYRFGANDMLMNEKYLVLVDRTVKEISVSKRDLKTEKQFDDPVMLNFDTLIQHYDEVSYLGRKNGLDRYQLMPQGGGMSSTDFFFDVNTKLVQKIEYRYREGQFVTIGFRVFNRQPVFAPGTFSETHYLAAANGKWTPSGQFAGFNITDLTGGK